MTGFNVDAVEQIIKGSFVDDHSFTLSVYGFGKSEEIFVQAFVDDAVAGFVTEEYFDGSSPFAEKYKQGT